MSVGSFAGCPAPTTMSIGSSVTSRTSAPWFDGNEMLASGSEYICARWKVLISPNPLVGPDRVNKNDNHSNLGFQHEGDEFRRWAQNNLKDNFFVICGDRHWQYHSVDPGTGLHELSAGPGSDRSALGSPGEDKTYHRFHRVGGGFVSVSVEPSASGSRLVLRHHDTKGAVVYESALGG